MNNKPKVMVAMSGGVDSSVAVVLLQEAGYEVAGITMNLGDAQVVAKAKAAAAALGISHYVLDLAKDFKEQVIDYFVDAYGKGKTPNPCVECNKKLKFGKLFAESLILGYDYFATGHYAKVKKQNGRYAIAKGDFLPKDQSYVLFTLSQAVLSRLLLPLGSLSKEQVRAKATEMGLVSAQQKDSQDICFIPDGDYRGFLAKQGSCSQPGDFVDKFGKVLGQHQGIACYTVGQRKGLGISFGHPVFVSAIKPEENQVVLGLEDDLLSHGFFTANNNFMTVSRLAAPMEVMVKVRYKSPPVPATIMPYPKDETLVQVVFAQPQKAITPGQAGVFYADELVVGGGVIL